MCGRTLHPGTPYLGDNVLSYHSCTHLPNKEGCSRTQNSERQLLFQGPRHTCSKVQGAGCAATYDYFYQTSYWWLNTAPRQMPHKCKNITIQCHVRTKILNSHQYSCKNDSKFLSHIKFSSKVFPFQKFIFLDFSTKISHLICLKVFTTIIHFLMATLYQEPG